MEKQKTNPLIQTEDKMVQAHELNRGEQVITGKIWLDSDDNWSNAKTFSQNRSQWKSTRRVDDMK